MHEPVITKTCLIAWLGMTFLMFEAHRTEAALPPTRSTYYDGGGKLSYGTVLTDDTSVAMTVEAWVYRMDGNRCETVVSRNYHDSYWFGFCSKPRFYRSGGTFADATVSVLANQWTHVAVSYDGAQARFYVDGQLAGVSALGNIGANRVQTLWLGGDPEGYNFNGYLDEVRIWMVARTQAQIQAHMWREVPSGTTGLSFISAQGGFLGANTQGKIFGILPRELVVPRSLLPITVDGNANLGTEYADAEQLVIRYRSGSQIHDLVAYLKYRDDDAANDHALYIGVTGVRDVVSGWDRYFSFVGVNVDPNYSRDALAQTNDFRVRGWLDASAATWGWGDGVGGFTIASSPPASNLWPVAYYYGSADLSPPSIEFKIDRALLGQFTEADGIMVGHFDVGPSGLSYLGPGDAQKASPATWTRMTYGDVSGNYPTVRLQGHVYDKDSAHPISGHRVFLYDEASVTVLYTRTTAADGSYDFDVVTPPNRVLRVAVDTCSSCVYLGPQLGAGTQPVSTNSVSAVFAGCPSGSCSYASVDFYLRRPIGPVALTGFTPDHGAPLLTLRDSPPKPLPPDRVRLYGANLHSFVRAYLYSCLDLPPSSNCVLGTDYFEAPIVDRDPNETWIEVEVPEVPRARWPAWWAWVVQDNWVRPGAVPWCRVGGGPLDSFRIAPQAYPKVYGFEFDNEDDSAGLGDFDGCSGNNAYLCIGAFGACLCRVRDPLYLLYYPIYKIWIDNANGSCNGMSATSLLFFHGNLTPEDFVAGAHYPAGLPGNPPLSPDGFLSAPKPESYDNPACGPRVPRNLWARIRSNHGVQASDEFIQVLLDQMHGAGLIPPEGAVSSISGNPRDVLSRVRASPSSYVLDLIPELGRGHVVAPYAVIDGVDTNGDGTVDRPDLSRILVYDNNVPEATDRYVEIDTTANRYRFPHGDSDWTGTGIYTVPIAVWLSERHAPGLVVAARLLALLIAGDADGLYTNSTGQWGWRADGTTVDTLTGAKAVVPVGVRDSITRNVLLALPTKAPPPATQINVRGAHYYFHATHGGVALQLEQNGGVAGDTDGVGVGLDPSNRLASLRYTPQRLSSNFNARVGMLLGDRQTAVFDFGGFRLGGGRSVEVVAQPGTRGVGVRNDAGAVLPFTLNVQHVDGESSMVATNTYGPFSLPTGAVLRLSIDNWPAATHLRSELDLNGDGTTDVTSVLGSTQTVGPPLPPALRIERQGSLIVIAWPLNSQSYFVQTNLSLTKPGAWQTLFLSPTVANGTNSVSVPWGGTKPSSVSARHLCRNRER